MRTSVPASLISALAGSYHFVSPPANPILALELMLQLPICPSRDVEGNRRTCGRNGKLLGVCVLQLIGT